MAVACESRVAEYKENMPVALLTLSNEEALYAAKCGAIKINFHENSLVQELIQRKRKNSVYSHFPFNAQMNEYNVSISV